MATTKLEVVLNVNDIQDVDIEQQPKTKPLEKEKTTTIAVTLSNQDKINTICRLMGKNKVNDVIDYFIKEYEKTMNVEEKNIYTFLLNSKKAERKK